MKTICTRKRLDLALAGMRTATAVRVRVVSLSSPVANLRPRRFQRGIEAMGQFFDVTTGAHATSRWRHHVATPRQRADDLIDAWFDPSVDIVWSTIGGYTTAQILEYLPLDEMARSPKLFIGYSDSTSLMATLYGMGVPTLHGPAVMPQFGEVGGLHEVSRASLTRALATQPMGELENVKVRTDEHLEWDADDHRPRRLLPASPRRAVRHGNASGPLFVANLGTLLSLAGTRFLPDLSGCVLVLEEDDMESAGTLERMLWQFRQLGLHKRVAAILFGRLPARVGVDDDVLAQMLLDALEGSTVPVAIGLEVGHVDPVLTLPNGALADLVVDPNTVRLWIRSSVIQHVEGVEV